MRVVNYSIYLVHLILDTVFDIPGIGDTERPIFMGFPSIRIKYLSILIKSLKNYYCPVFPNTGPACPIVLQLHIGVFFKNF